MTCLWFYIGPNELIMSIFLLPGAHWLPAKWSLGIAFEKWKWKGIIELSITARSISFTNGIHIWTRHKLSWINGEQYTFNRLIQSKITHFGQNFNSSQSSRVFQKSFFNKKKLFSVLRIQNHPFRPKFRLCNRIAFPENSNFCQKFAIFDIASFLIQTLDPRARGWTLSIEHLTK